MNDLIRVHVVISGRVQGVFFRMETKKKADTCDVCGWVRNRPDGSVEAVFEGERERVEEVLDWCRQGPPAARVDAVETSEQPVTGDCRGFDIAY
jgi:acylphosphatase